MKNYIPESTSILPTLIKNVHLSLILDGWPAAVAIIAVSLSGVTIYALKTLGPSLIKTQPEIQYSRMAA